jgi:hypothetical protein
MAFTRIVKIERPVSWAEGDEELWRIFDEKREHAEEVAPDKYLRDWMGARMECFFHATWSKDESWIINRRARWQHWV